MRFATIIALLVASLTITAPITKATVLTCQDALYDHKFNGMALGSPLTSSGLYITAFFDVGEWHFNPCSNGETEFPKRSGSFAWVMFQSAVNANLFFQIGIADCNDDTYPGLCAGTSNPHYFFGMRVCGSTQFQWLDIGPADWNAHRYSIQKTTQWLFRIDGVNEYTIALNDSRVSCWANGDSTAQWSFETWDDGDGLGHLSGTSQHPSDVTSAQVQFTGEAAPHDPNWNGNNPCTKNQYGANHHMCDVLGVDRFEVWSTG